MKEIGAFLAGGTVIVATIISFFNISLAVDIFVNATIVACFAGIFYAVVHAFSGN